MKLPRAILLVLLTLLVPAARSDGAPIYFDFTLNFTSGPLNGQSVTGSLSVDDADCTAPGGLCSGTFDPSGPLDLLSFDVTVGGFAFTMTDEADFPDLPQIVFTNDVITAINYLGFLPNGVRLDLRTFGDPDVIFVGVNFAISNGNFVGSTREQPTPVPEPASLTLLGLGLAGLGARRWRQRRNR